MVNAIAVLLHGQPVEFVYTELQIELCTLDGRIIVVTRDLLTVVTLAGVQRPRAMAHAQVRSR